MSANVLCRLSMLLAVLSAIRATAVNQSLSTSTSWPGQRQPNKLAKYTLDGRPSGKPYMSEVGSSCAADGFYPDREDCRKFHVCFNGIQSIRWCKDGMLWDENKIGCSSQNQTQCPNARKKWGRNEESTTIPTTTTMGSRTMKSNYTCRPGLSGLFADPSSCSIYHWCVFGSLQSTHHCNLGLHFSASASGCILPKDAECEGQIAPAYAPIECAMGSSGYFPDPYDCSVFHYCNGFKNRSESLLCTAGRLWSSRHENCVWPDEVLECQNTCPTNYSSQMRFADASDCSQYAQCVDGHLERRICSNGFLFDRITKMCKPYDQAECHGSKPDSFLASATTNSPYRGQESQAGNSPPTGEVRKKPRINQFSCIVDGYYSDTQDCRIYHVCIDGLDYRSACASGLAWEPLLRLCMPISMVNCHNSKSIDVSLGASKNKWFHAFTRSVVKTTTPTPFVFPSIFTCVGRANGYYADPVHCHKFHYCATGWQSMMECDEGLAYSTRDRECVPLDLSDCAPARG